MNPSKAPLRVAYCVTSFDLGGTELNAIRTMESIDRALVSPMAVVLRTDGVLRSRYEAASIPLLTLPLGHFASARAVRAGVRLVHFLREQRIDVFHSQDVYTNIFGVPCARWHAYLCCCQPTVVACHAEAPACWGPPLVCRHADYVTANSDRVRELVIREDRFPPDRVVAFPTSFRTGRSSLHLPRSSGHGAIGTRFQPGRLWWAPWRGWRRSRVCRRF